MCKTKYESLSILLKLVFIISHGQGSVERGFNINKDHARTNITGASLPNLVLSRGLVNIDLFYIWYQATSQGLIQQLNGTILLLNSQQIPVMWWSFKNAYPVKWEGPQLNASSDEVAVEKIELVHQGISKFGRFSG